MSVIGKLLGIVAPHHCMICGDEGAVVCAWCLPDFAAPLPDRCYLCKVATSESRVCEKCRRRSVLRHVWVRALYDGPAKQLVHDFKFERKQAAAGPISSMMKEALPYIDAEVIVTHIPTATSRVRKRGYDHAELIARALAGQLGLQHETLLYRITQTRQVGSRRTERIKQMEQAFVCKDAQKVAKRQILLVDDLTTTGATLEAAARCLKTQGARAVSAAVFAQK